MPYTLAIFDLDGTLADSFPWFKRNVNVVADHYGFRRLSADEIEAMRHLTTREIVERLHWPRWKMPFIVRHMRKLKTQQAADIPLFDGVPAMLAALAAGGLKLALVSSDTEANARQKLGASAKLFADFDCSASLFGKPAKFKRVLKRARVSPSETISIGDETRDIDAARAVGMACAAVTWGYATPQALRNHKPDLMFERMDDIVSHLVDGRSDRVRALA